jgi:hypothetical protein
MGGLGSVNWMSSTFKAGAGGRSPGQGGNAGLVILTYTDPTGSCSL